MTDPIRSARSRRTCHLPAEHPELRPIRASRGYVPELSETLERDPNLCDGARRCVRLLGAYTYRRNRDTREAEITVTYLMRTLGRCRRTVQRYLRQLERAGYIETHVIASGRARMCVGLAVRLLRPLFARHHAEKWPLVLKESGATRLSQKQRFRYKTVRIALWHWTQRCCEPIRRSHMKTIPAFTPFP
jgi:hypothetical protein